MRRAASVSSGRSRSRLARQSLPLTVYLTFFRLQVKFRSGAVYIRERFGFFSLA